MKHGFMLIELIIATLIASMIATLLLTALAQSGRFQIAIDNVVDTSLRVGIISNQLDKDLMGAFIPVQARAESDKEKKSPAPETAGAGGQAAAQTTGNKTGDEKKTETQEKKKPLEKIFYSTNKESNLDQLTFITNNPLTVFVGKDVGVVKPKIVRVTYVLKPETDTEVVSYALYRQESLELDLAQVGNVRQYEIMGGIKSLAITYTARIEKKEEAKKEGKEKEGSAAQKEQAKVHYEYTTSKDWASERKKESDKQQEFPRIPHSVEVALVLWDKQYKKEKEFTMVSEIPVSGMIEKPSDEGKESPPPPSRAAANERQEGGQQ